MPRGSSGTTSKRSGHHNPPSTPLKPQPRGPSRSRSSSSVTSVAGLTAAADPAPAVAGHTPGWTVKTGAAAAIPKYYDGEDGGGGCAGELSARRIDVVHAGDAAGSATVLTAFPLLDTITLLIIFLQLPSTLLTVIHFLYALQTFVPPSTTLLSASTPAALPSFSNLLLQGSNGSPSLLTIIFADIVVALVSMFLWPPARAFLIDFAQAVIAISFGAGNEGGSAGKNVAVCAGLMSGIRVMQGRFTLSDAWDSIQPTNREEGGYLFLPRSEPSGWIRSMVAIHIVAQWGMQLLRRQLKKRPEAGEAAASVVGAAAGGKDGAKTRDKDPEAAAVAPALERGDSVSGAKRRKKNQALSIRNNQPLWATVANMIVHLAKEIERSRTSSEAQATGAVETALPDGGDQVWITRIGSNEISFVASLAAGKSDGYDPGNPPANDAPPFFVRVNGIVWPQTDIAPAGRDSPEFNVDITGLTGSTEYDFEFVRSPATPFYTTSACTLPAQPSSTPLPTPPPPPPSRPLSPITTLLHSLALATTTLTETKTTLKTLRKSHKSHLSDLRREIEKHRTSLNPDRSEERTFRRNLSLRETIKRAEDAADAATTALTALTPRPAEIRPRWDAARAAARREKDTLAEHTRALARARDAAARRADALTQDLAALAAKREKLHHRILRLRADLDRLLRDNDVGRDTLGRRRADRAALSRRRNALEAEFVDAIRALEARADELAARAAENWGAVYALESQGAAAEGLFAAPPPPPPGLPVPAVGAEDRERSDSIFSDGSVVTNVSELNWVAPGGALAGFLPAFEPQRRQAME